MHACTQQWREKYALTSYSNKWLENMAHKHPIYLNPLPPRPPSSTPSPISHFPSNFYIFFMLLRLVTLCPRDKRIASYLFCPGQNTVPYQWTGAWMHHPVTHDWNVDVDINHGPFTQNFGVLLDPLHWANQGQLFSAPGTHLDRPSRSPALLLREIRQFCMMIPILHSDW